MLNLFVHVEQVICRSLQCGSWLLGTSEPLDVDGPIETVRQGDDNQVANERKIDQVVDVLGRYKVDVAALQETKWFGEDEYRVGKCVVLAAGRSVPGPGVVKQRGGCCHCIIWSSSWCLERRRMSMESLEFSVDDSYFEGGAGWRCGRSTCVFLLCSNICC